MTPAEQDIKIFEIAGTLLFGSSKYTIGSAGADLEKLGLAPLRRKAWSTFFSAMEEAVADKRFDSQSECWAEQPDPSTTTGESMWSSFRADPVEESHKRLLSQAQVQPAPPAPPAVSSTVVTSRASSVEGSIRGDGRKPRIRRTPSFLNRYHTDNNDVEEAGIKRRRIQKRKAKSHDNRPSTPPRAGRSAPPQRRTGIDDDPAYNSDALIPPRLRRSPRKHGATYILQFSSTRQPTRTTRPPARRSTRRHPPEAPGPHHD
ncbi:hypothetical protein V8E36_009070 [Tilletia maclaganii]